MAMTFPRFSSLTTHQFRAVRFNQRIAEICDELDRSRDLVQWQCLSAIVIMTSVVYLLVRGLDSLWALAFVIPILAVGGASLQHALTLYRFYVHSYVMPTLCEMLGRFRYTIGDAPDLCFTNLVGAGVLPRHNHHFIDDVVFGDYKGHQLTLAMVNLRQERDDQLYQAMVVAIQWPTRPLRLPVDAVTQIIGGQERLKLIWSDGYLMLALPCSDNPFDLGGLFEPPEEFERRLEHLAVMLQIPQNLIDQLLETPYRQTTTA